MSVPRSIEREMLNETEFEAVETTHYPAISSLDRDGLARVADQMRACRDEARDRLRAQRRARRTKDRGRVMPSGEERSSASIRNQIFTAALRRVKNEQRRFAEAEKRQSQKDIAVRALELKRANRVRNHPQAGRTPDEGMRSNPSEEFPPRYPSET